MEEEIKAEFQKNGFNFDDEGEVLKKCLTFCINYNLKPSDLVSSWEVYYLNRQLDESTVKDDEMDGFMLHLQNEQKEAIIKEEPSLHIYSSKDVDMILNDEDENIAEDILGTPPDNLKLYSDALDSTYKANANGYSSDKPSKLVTPFGRRTEKLVVKFNINNLPNTENGCIEHDDENTEDDIIKRIKTGKKCSLMVHGSGPEPGCRFMYDRTEDRFNALENRIRKHANALVSSGLYEEPTDPTVASQRTLFAVGMICCDGDGHLNDKSVLLQSSVEHSGGQRVRLDLHKLGEFSLFPGQVVGIEGSNPSGHCLIASKLVDQIPLPVDAVVDVHPSMKQALDQEIHSTVVISRPEEISMIIAAGPFTTTDNLYFEPLKELISYAKRKQPQLLILLGPFVDSEHPQIKKGTTDSSFDEIFHLEILRRLQDYVEYMGSEVRAILVPSIRDANHDFVLPQPPFDIQPPHIIHQITSLTNPGTFEANQIKVGCCTVDVLKQLSGEEMSRCSKDGTSNDRMEGIPLDFSLAQEALTISTIPDIIILPSDMKYFIKVLSLGGRNEGEEQKKCVCVNPGRLAKGEGSGTFAEIYYHGSPEMMNASIISI
ncbi:hypothetical protein WN944_020151 [Citrus x changshan-huyou]|uniref:DNA polymerase alpha subunit B n=1 Tax=Citrus x changshan-huyou TaxID=2935761 RepID=A0AAP0LXM6_9ROSI